MGTFTSPSVRVPVRTARGGMERVSVYTWTAGGARRSPGYTVEVGARIFLLSPAHCGGERARLVLRDEARFDLARRLRTREGAPLGEVFSFLSGLYFRGKLAYASTFA